MIIGSVFCIDSLKVYLNEHQPFSQDGIGHLKISVGLSAPNGLLKALDCRPRGPRFQPHYSNRDFFH